MTEHKTKICIVGADAARIEARILSHSAGLEQFTTEVYGQRREFDTEADMVEAITGHRPPPFQLQFLKWLGASPNARCVFTGRQQGKSHYMRGVRLHRAWLYGYGDNVRQALEGTAPRHSKLRAKLLKYAQRALTGARAI